MTLVVNIKHSEYDVFIGRKREGMHFGNPFSSKDSSIAEESAENRRDSISKFRKWLNGIAYHDVEPERREWILENLHLLKNNKLGCFCKPKSCHGDVYVEMISDNGLLEY